MWPNGLSKIFDCKRFRPKEKYVIGIWIDTWGVDYVLGLYEIEFTCTYQKKYVGQIFCTKQDERNN